MQDVLVSFLNDNAAAEDWNSDFFLPGIGKGDGMSCEQTEEPRKQFHDIKEVDPPQCENLFMDDIDFELETEDEEAEARRGAIGSDSDFQWFSEAADLITSDHHFVLERDSRLASIIETPNEDWVKPYISCSEEHISMYIDEKSIVAVEQDNSCVYASKPAKSQRQMKKKPKTPKSSFVKKMNKIPLNIRLTRLVDKLREMRAPPLPVAEATPKEIVYTEPVDLYQKAETFLRAMMSNEQCSSSELNTCLQPRATFNSSSLSSLIMQVKSWVNQKKNLNVHSVWNASCLDFPNQHTGAGQIAGAARGFATALSDIIPPSVYRNLEFRVDLSKSDCLLNGNLFSSVFTWRTVGMTKLGYPNDLECHGLIRCVFKGDKIVRASISFDAFKIIHQVSCISF